MHKKTLVNTRQLEQLLRNTLIPLSQNGAAVHLFDIPPRSMQQLEIKEFNARPLRERHDVKPYPGYYCWPEENVNSIEVPVLGCVYQGQINYEVHTPPGTKGKRWVIPVKQGTFFMVRPGVPFTAGRTKENSVEYARCVLFHLRRDGVNLRSFTMDKDDLWQHPYFFFPDPEPHLLGERLLHELQKTHQFSLTIVHHYLLLILLLIQRNAGSHKLISMGDDGDIVPLVAGTNPLLKEAAINAEVRMAIDFIYEHLGDSQLNCQQVAAHTGISERHLNRLFTQNMGQPLFQFVQQQRLERAHDLLQNPTLSIQQVGTYCGFPVLSHFSAWFRKHQQCSPREYRARMSQLFGGNLKVTAKIYNLARKK